MFLTKSEPDVVKDGKIKTFIEIKDGELLINDKYKYAEGKWYFYGEDEKWYYLGVGANPNITVDGDDILDQALFDNVFEEITEE